MLKHGVYLAPSAYEVGFLNAAMRKNDIEYFIRTLKKIIIELPAKIRDFG